MLSTFLLITWFLSVLPAILVLFHFMEKKDQPFDGLAICVVLVLVGPITITAFLLWAVYRSARVLFGLLPRASPQTSSNSKSKENASS